jgi:type II secretion system protein D
MIAHTKLASSLCAPWRRWVLALGVLLAAGPLGHAQQPSANTATTIKAYPCPNGDAESWAARLRPEFQADPNVRIAADPRTGQLLVHGTPEVHAQVIQRLSAPAAGQAPARPVAAGRTTVERPTPGASIVALQHRSGQQIEQSLVALLGARLVPIGTAELGTKSYTLAIANTGSVQIDVQGQTNRVRLQGPAASVEGMTRLVQALDTADSGPERITRTVTLERSNPALARRTIEAIRASEGNRQVRPPMVTVLFQQPDDAPAAPAAPPVPPAVPPVAPPAAPAAPADQPPAEGPLAGIEGEAAAGAMIGPVRVEMLPGLDVIVLQGHQRDVERVMEIINQIERLSAETDPAIVVHHLRNVDSSALTELIAPLYDQIYALRQGFVSINALVKPNALLLIGRRESVDTVLDLVRKLDKPVDPETQFQVFRLQHASALAAQQTVLEFFTPGVGLAPRVRVTSDFRSNALVVAASPRDLAEAGMLIDRLDTPTSAKVNELRVFQLENSLADELAPILQAAVSGQQQARTGVGIVPGLQLPGQAGAAQQRPQDQASMMLRFITVDTKGQRKLESGILTDVRITADTRANALLVSAPAESMDLLDALIRQLDKMPMAEAQLKVFTIVNGDATSLAEMLQSLFARQQQTAAVQLAPQLGGLSGDNQVVTLRFAVDVRTNSIIASGTPGDLQVVEAILLRLDDSDVRHRRSVVYRLKNAPAADVANAINQFLQTERQVQQVAPGLISPFEQIEREVVVVPEPVSNSLIVSATPRFFDEIKKIVEELDQRPPMVMIQVLIGEVGLNNTDEFGVEIGLQDSILFDRSLLGNIVTTTRTTYNADGQPTSQNQEIASATYTPGFAFNNQPLGQSSGQGTSNIVGTQGLSHFSVGRVNNDLGFGGLVLSASSESVSVLIRALKECRRLDVLSRPQIMTLDNQPAFIQVGQRVPRIVGTTVNQTAQVNNITLENVGLILGVTPRISPEGLIVMEIDAEKSEVGPEAEGIPVSISATGQVIRSPRINTITAQTTVSAANGQTIVLGGLINKRKAEFHRKVPWLGDIPIVGMLFRYDGVATQKTELLIIMTPHIVRTEADAEKLKRVESARMHWCLGDVLAMHGSEVGPQRTDECPDSDTVVIYPALNPSGHAFGPSPTPAMPLVDGAEIVPTPQGSPMLMRPQTPTMAPTMPPGSHFQRPQPAPQEAQPMSAPARLVEPPTEPVLPSPLTGDSSSNGSQLRLRSGQTPVAAPSTGFVQPAAYEAPAYQPPAYQPAALQPPAYQPPTATFVPPLHSVAPSYAPPSHPTGY